MKMKSKLLFVPMAAAVMTALLVTNVESTPNTAAAEQMRWTTTGRPGLSLNGKMFTLSLYGGGIYFYSPSFSAPSSSPSFSPPSSFPSPSRGYTTSSPTTDRHTAYPPWTTAPSTSGVSVCLRYMTDFMRARDVSLFTLSPSRTPMKLGVDYSASYSLTFNGYYKVDLRPNRSFWSDIRTSVWTSVCVTVDTMKNVVQVFSGSSMSIRKVLITPYVWSGEPVIDFSGFDGQLTDVQVWDYPLRYKEVFYYMTNGYYGPCRGSALTWSNIGYSVRGNTLLEDAYDLQAKQPIRRGGRGRRLESQKKPRKLFSVGGNKEAMRPFV